MDPWYVLRCLVTSDEEEYQIDEDDVREEYLLDEHRDRIIKLMQDGKQRRACIEIVKLLLSESELVNTYREIMSEEDK
jgi:hypothetical protein